MRGALMVCGTASDVGKSQIVAGLCRLLARQGVRVAPFKAQNMALNSFVTPGGHEIGRAQAMQAMAAGVEPDVTMNPILLKPSGETTSQVVVMGRPWDTLDAAEFHRRKPELRGVVLEALADLRSRYDVVLLEGAGSPSEINLPEDDLVNLGLASTVGIPAIVVGDIDRGGVFAALYGTTALLPVELRRWVRGFVINKFRGDPAVLVRGTEELRRRLGVPTFGVLPFAEGLTMDAEDSVSLSLARSARSDRPARSPWSAPGVPFAGRPAAGGAAVDGGDGVGDVGGLDGRAPAPLDVAVVRFPHISNFTDVDALAVEPGVSVRFVDHTASLGRPDLIVLPGTKSTVADLAWLRYQGFDEALDRLRLDVDGSVRPDSPLVLGICGGYQMLGTRIEDPGSVETRAGTVTGLRLLDLRTVLLVDKHTRQRHGRTSWRQSAAPRPATPGRGPAVRGAPAAVLADDDWELEGSPRQAPFLPVSGYEIHHGRPYPGPSAIPWFLLGDARGKRNEGIVDDAGGVLGSSLHGLLEGDELRNAVLGAAAERQGRVWETSGVSFAAARQGQIERLADLCRDHLDLDGLWQLVIEGGGTTTTTTTADDEMAVD